MLDWLKDLFSPIRLTDPQFGALRYLRDARFWEGTATFAPTGQPVEVLIDGPPSGPTESQRAFFTAVEERYPAMWTELEPRLRAEAQRVEAACEFFRVACIGIPEDPEGAPSWELSFECEPPSWHYTVSFRGWDAGDILAEC